MRPDLPQGRGQTIAPGFLLDGTLCGAAPLFDHLVGQREQVRRHDEAQRLSGLEIDHKLEFFRLDHGQVGGLFAFENAAAAVFPTMTAERSRRRSATSAGNRSGWPSAERSSIVTFWPSTKLVCFRPSRNAVTRLAASAIEALRKKPTSGSTACCACAANGRVTVAPAAPMSVMNCRRLTGKLRPAFRLSSNKPALTITSGLEDAGDGNKQNCCAIYA